MKHVFPVVILICLLASCRQRGHVVNRGIYYWKTVYNPGDYEKNTIEQIDCNTIYLRLFDVDWDEAANNPVPLGPVNIKQQLSAQHKYVPVIFITPKTLNKIKKQDIDELVGSVNNLATDICKRAGLNYTEVQLDCDWTVPLKEKYFLLLNELKKQKFFNGKTISATIRMHQVKYIKASGIPPVDKGLLMCYNLGNIKNIGTRNSILEYTEAEKYLSYVEDYPLPLDVALPLFDWCLLFREGKLKGILRDVRPADIIADKTFIHKEDNLYINDTGRLFHGYTLKKGDMIRVEEPAMEDVVKTARHTAKTIANDTLNVILFHCDSLTLSKYTIHEMERVFSVYR